MDVHTNNGKDICGIVRDGSLDGCSSWVISATLQTWLATVDTVARPEALTETKDLAHLRNSAISVTRLPSHTHTFRYKLSATQTRLYINILTLIYYTYTTLMF